MKHFIALLLIFLSSSAFSMSDNDVLVTENKIGGKIYLVSKECPLPGSEGAKISFTIGANNLIVSGCWLLHENKIHVIWLPKGEQPVKIEYDPEIFHLEKIL